MYHYDFWGRRLLKKEFFLADWLFSQREAGKVSLEDAKKESLDAWNFIQENK
jgi:hypothetical protein